MARNPEYQEFLDTVNGKRDAEIMRIDEEEPATDEEVGWWKQHQIKKAIHAARYGTATPVQQSLLERQNEKKRLAAVAKQQKVGREIVVTPQAKKRTLERENI